MSKVEIILNDQSKINKNDLLKFKSEAIDNWHKSNKLFLKHKKKMQECENVIVGCNERLRLISILEN